MFNTLGNMPIEEIIASLLVIFLCIPVHEWAHCFVAYLLGDDTPEQLGRLTLNPLVHIDPIGALMIFFTNFGWGRAARVNPYKMHRVKNPRVGMALTAVAGPLSNIAMAMLFAIPIRLIWIYNWPSYEMASRITNLLIYPVAINIGLAAFNLLPIPPLDGSRILVGVMPDPIASAIEGMERYAIFILLAVVYILPQMGFDLISLMVAPLQDLFISILFA